MAATISMELAYRSLWRAALPLIRWYVQRKDHSRLVPSSATAERFGRSHRPASWRRDPHWQTWWIHGASVGECVSALPLVELMLSPRWPSHDRTRIVVTTTTPAARELLQRRLAMLPASDRVVCVFAPLDHPDCVRRFYETWQPRAGLWIESELWPTLILEAASRKIRIGVLNGRVSPRSLRVWKLPLLHGFARRFMAKFSLVLCQDDANRHRFQLLGASHPETVANLKFASPRIENDASAVSELASSLAGRVVWVAASTHEQEEAMVTSVHMALVARIPSEKLLTVIIPRHPERGLRIRQQINEQFPALQVTLRSAQALPMPETDIFIVDTMGETSLFFDAIPTVVMGGTFIPRGGHNPIEPLRAGCHVVTGPHMFNFSDIVAQLQSLQPRSSTTGTRSTSSSDPFPSLIDTVPSVDQLTEHLAKRLGHQLSPAPSHDLAISTHMQTLAVTSLGAYETRLLQWLASSPS